jgi:structure-specific endonuclease subunit SLX1
MTEKENHLETSDSKYEEFYCCYLLRSLAPKYKQTSYIGSTNDPKKRLRQHNGEIALGAKKTTNKRPWEMILFVYGFPNHVAALQFEWSWQNPSKTRRLQLKNREEFKENDDKLSTSLYALSKILKDKFWSRWPLHLHILIPIESIIFRQDKFTKINAINFFDIENLSKNIRITNGNIEEFNNYHKNFIRKFIKNEYLKYLGHTKNNLPYYCNLCLDDVNFDNHKNYVNCLNMECNTSYHVTCLAKKFTKLEALENSTFKKPYDELDEEILPVSGKCPGCQTFLLWGDLIQAMMVREKYVQNDLILND